MIINIDNISQNDKIALLFTHQKGKYFYSLTKKANIFHALLVRELKNENEEKVEEKRNVRDSEVNIAFLL